MSQEQDIILGQLGYLIELAFRMGESPELQAICPDLAYHARRLADAADPGHGRDPERVALAGPEQPASPPTRSTRIVRAFDVSNYSGYLSDSWADQMRLAGYEHAIVRLDLVGDVARQSVAQEQLACFRRVGLGVSGYLFPDYSREPGETLGIIERFYGSLASLWIDIETGDANCPNDASQVARWLGAATAVFPGVLGVYTAAWVAAYVPGLDTVDLSPYPLWIPADYEQPSQARPFGLWQAVAGIQHSQERGQVCDVDLFEAWALGLS